jgi:hypothetical protein
MKEKRVNEIFEEFAREDEELKDQIERRIKRKRGWKWSRG